MRSPNENGIQSIRIRNFKVFREQANFNIRGRHVLVYGPNGSGKSSLYWALYTLLQAVTKTPGETDKYFVYQGPESLLNIHETDGTESFIELDATIENATHQAHLDPNGLSVDGVSQAAGAVPRWFSDLDRSAEFMNHRQLAAFYGFANSEPIDLIYAFEDGFYPFLMLANGNTFHAELKEIRAELSRISTRARVRKQAIEDGRLRSFNEAWGALVVQVRATINRFLRKNFSSRNFRVVIEPTGRYRIIKQERQWAVAQPAIKLSIEQLRDDGHWHSVDRPQSFLNEAMLTRMGLSIRFTLMLRRPQNLPLNLLLLDDVLISMDMDNRLLMLRMIKRRYYSNYQLFIFTHDKGLYNLIKRELDDVSNDWAIYEVSKTSNDSCVVSEGKSELKRAEEFLEKGDLEACALELRKLAEIILRQYVKRVKPEIFSDNKFVSLGKLLKDAKAELLSKTLRKLENTLLGLNLSDEEVSLVKGATIEPITRHAVLSGRRKTQLIAIRAEFLKLSEHANVNTNKALDVIKEVEKIKDRILNLGAHPTDEPLYATEMEEAVNIFAGLKDVLFAAS